MFKLIGIITVCILASMLIVLAGDLTCSNFYSDVLSKDILSIIANIIGFNLVIAPLLLTSINGFQKRLGVKEDCYISAKTEIKNNIYFLIGIFCITLIILSLGDNIFPSYLFIKKTLVVSSIVLSVITFFQIIKAIFDFDKFETEFNLSNEKTLNS